MKIKLDFITNSSSTAYIVMIPDNFNTAKSLAKISNENSYQDDLYEYCNDDKAKFIEQISENMSNLLNGEDLWGYDTPCFNTTQEMLEKEDFIIAMIDVSSDGGGQITPADKETIKKLQQRFENNENKT